jgi:hypothetical protein
MREETLEEEEHKKSYKFAFNQIWFLCFAKKAENRKKYFRIHKESLFR